MVSAANMNTYISNNLSFLGGTAAAVVTTSQTTTSTSYTDLSTSGPAVTLATLTTAIVLLSATAYNSTGGDGAGMSVAVSGSTTIAAADGSALLQVTPSGVSVNQVGTSVLLTGLTKGNNTFTAKYKAISGGTATFSNRTIAVIPLTT